MKVKYLISIVLIAVLTSACSAKIKGVVKLTDMNMKPLTNESPEGIVVNMINTTGSLESGSHAVTTDALGNFISADGKVKSGTYKIEATKFGYVTDTQTIQVGGFGTREVTLVLKKILQSQRRSIRARGSDADKIINPGEVNIQPPSM